MLTITFAMLLLFPLFLLCSDWWKRKVYPLFEVYPQSYQAINTLVHKCPNLSTINLNLNDNGLDSEKFRIIRSIMETGRLKLFSLRNTA